MAAYSGAPIRRDAGGKAVNSLHALPIVERRAALRLVIVCKSCHDAFSRHIRYNDTVSFVVVPPSGQVPTEQLVAELGADDAIRRLAIAPIESVADLSDGEFVLLPRAPATPDGQLLNARLAALTHRGTVLASTSDGELAFVSGNTAAEAAAALFETIMTERQAFLDDAQSWPLWQRAAHDLGLGAVQSPADMQLLFSSVMLIKTAAPVPLVTIVPTPAPPTAACGCGEVDMEQLAAGLPLAGADAAGLTDAEDACASLRVTHAIVAARVRAASGGARCAGVDSVLGILKSTGRVDEAATAHVLMHHATTACKDYCTYAVPLSLPTQTLLHFQTPWCLCIAQPAMRHISFLSNAASDCPIPVGSFQAVASRAVAPLRGFATLTWCVPRRTTQPAPLLIPPASSWIPSAHGRSALVRLAAPNEMGWPRTRLSKTTTPPPRMCSLVCSRRRPGCLLALAMRWLRVSEKLETNRAPCSSSAFPQHVSSSLPSCCGASSAACTGLTSLKSRSSKRSTRRCAGEARYEEPRWARPFHPARVACLPRPRCCPNSKQRLCRRNLHPHSTRMDWSMAAAFTGNRRACCLLLCFFVCSHLPISWNRTSPQPSGRRAGTASRQSRYPHTRTPSSARCDIGSN